MVLEINFFLILSFILASLQFSSSVLNPEVLGNGWTGKQTCDTIPHPFGIAGVAFPGFEIECIKEGSESWIGIPYLHISDGMYGIEEISLQGYIKILAEPIRERCLDANGKWMETEGSGQLNLDGTPFTLSYQYNMLTVVGCNSVVLIRRPDNLTSGCVTFCDPQGMLSSGSCSGIGCCQATLPGSLKSFDLEFTYVNITNSSEDLHNCTTAFFAERDDFQTNKSRFLFQNSKFDKLYFYRNNPLRLEWAIGNMSCEVAKKDTGSFACKPHSDCYDSPTMSGYLCNCSQGYQGNPYKEHGCTDVNECLEPDLNTCVGQCINSPGTYSCSCPRGMTGDGKKEGSGCKTKHDIPFGAGLGILFILVISSFFSYWVVQKRNMAKMRSQFFKQNGGYLLQQRLSSQGIDSTTKIFTENELQKATENYSERKILGQGGFCTVYKGTLSDQKVVAIKRSRIEDENQIEQFVNEILILSQINHRNVVKLLGCCLETRVPLLVYEFVPNGTLLRLIHSQNSEFHLPWDCRLRISAEAAGALAYLHSAASFPIIHRDIKSSNILLDEKFTAKVSDFGASRSVPFDKSHLTTLVQGTIGYLDPEYFQTGQLTEKSDVYSFGVVLAELLTGEKPVSLDRPEEYHNLAMYFIITFDDGRLLQVVDPRVAKEAPAQELYVVAQLTRRSLNTKGEERPTMKEVAIELEALRRMTNQQSQNGRKMQQMVVVGEVSSADTEECITQYRLDTQMLSSMAMFVTNCNSQVSNSKTKALKGMNPKNSKGAIEMKSEKPR